MAKVNEFMAKNIAQHLVKLGLDQANASWCADRGVKHYEKHVVNSKNPFTEACDYAGAIAEQRSLTFKYSSPKSKTKPRRQKPQDIFDF